MASFPLEVPSLVRPVLWDGDGVGDGFDFHQERRIRCCRIPNFHHFRMFGDLLQLGHQRLLHFLPLFLRQMGQPSIWLFCVFLPFLFAVFALSHDLLLLLIFFFHRTCFFFFFGCVGGCPHTESGEHPSERVFVSSASECIFRDGFHHVFHVFLQLLRPVYVRRLALAFQVRVATRSILRFHRPFVAHLAPFPSTFFSQASFPLLPLLLTQLACRHPSQLRRCDAKKRDVARRRAVKKKEKKRRRRREETSLEGGGEDKAALDRSWTDPHARGKERQRPRGPCDGPSKGGEKGSPIGVKQMRGVRIPSFVKISMQTRMISLSRRVPSRWTGSLARRGNPVEYGSIPLRVGMGFERLFERVRVVCTRRRRGMHRARMRTCKRT